jgi:hypothetical protein
MFLTSLTSYISTQLSLTLDTSIFIGVVPVDVDVKHVLIKITAGGTDSESGLIKQPIQILSYDFSYKDAEILAKNIHVLISGKSGFPGVSDLSQCSCIGRPVLISQSERFYIFSATYLISGTFSDTETFVDLSELIINGDFSNWTNGELDSWFRDFDNSSNCYIIENPSNHCQFIRNLAFQPPLYRYQTNLIIGKNYRCIITVDEINSGFIYCCNGSGTSYSYDLSIGETQFTFTAIEDNGFYIMTDAEGSEHTDIIISSISIKEI